MRVISLALKQFRNIEELTLRPGGGVNVIYGDNAQGKTNLIEALWLFTGGRSLRGGLQSDLIAFGKSAAALDLVFYAGGREQTATLRLGGKKTATLNEISLDSPTKLAGVFPAVVFFPEHLSLIKEGPAVRRRFLDDAIGQVMPRYQRYLADYNRVLTQRASLLEEVYRQPSLEPMLEVWDEHFVRFSWAILKARRRYVLRLQEQAVETYRGISRDAEVLSLSYLSTLPVADGLSDDEGMAVIRQHLLDIHGEDIRAGATTVGPHRDDLELFLDGYAARSFGSQGQQRSCALALKLAECSLLEEVVGERPIILLDDVLSELDKSRQEYLLSGFGESQVFLTCCDPAYLEGLEQTSAFEIRGGQLIN